MIRLRREAQKTLWEGVVDEDVKALWEPWMIAVDALLSDEELVGQVYEAQGERHEKSRTRGRWQTPAETVLRLLLLKHVRNWSYDVVEREVRAKLVYRDFTRIGLGKVPDAKRLARIGQAIGGEVIAELHRRWVEMGQEKGVVAGRKMRVDTTVVESNIHYPTDSSLLGDGARVLTRTMKKIEKQAGQLKRKLRDRTRSVRKQVLGIALSGRLRGSEGEQRRQQRYGKLLHLSRQILNDTRRVMAEVEELGRVKRKRVEAMMELLEQMSGRMKQVMEQTKARIFAGWTQMPGKLVSIFEPQTEIIRKGKASKPTEFGKLVQIQEAEIFEHRPSDRELLLPAIEAQQNKLGRVARLVTADAGFYSQAQERAAQDKGVQWVAVPNRQTRSAERKKLEKIPWFKKAQAWRTGCEGRISVLKRRHGLTRCRYPGMEGMKRWVGMGVLADNVINLGKALAEART